MKKQLVIITSSIFPSLSATGSIALQCAKYLEKDFDIRIIALQQGKHRVYGIDEGGYKLYTVTQWRYYLNQVSESNIKSSFGIKRLFFNCVFFLTRLLGKIESTFFFLDNRWWYNQKAYRLLLKLNEDRPIDGILSVSSPVEAHFAARKFKEKFSDTFWVSYWADLFSGKNYQQNLFVDEEKMISIENQLIADSDQVLTTEEIYHIYQNRAELDLCKLSYVPYTMKDKILSRSHYESKSGNYVDFICMGSLNRFMRDPSFVLDVFSESTLDERFILHLYTSGCDALVDKAHKLSPDHIISHGKVSPDKLEYAMNKADILINIGNSQATSIPSKIMELFSYRKPIIDFYYPGQRLSIFEEYPLSIQIEMNNNYDEARNRINEFVSDNIGRMVDESYLFEVFSKYTENNAQCVIHEAINRAMGIKGDV